MGLYGMGAILLLYIELFLVVGSLTNIVRGLDAERWWLYQVLFVVVSVGWWGGYRKRNPWGMWGLALFVGAGIVLFRAGNLWGPALAFLRNLVFYLSNQLSAGIQGILYDRFVDLWPAYNSLILSKQEFLSLWLAVLNPLENWIQGVITGDVVYERAVVILLWSGVLMYMAFWAGWMLRRWERPLAALLPAGVVLAGSFSYVREDAFLPLASFVGIALLLIGLHRQFRQEKSWQRNQFDYAEDVRLDTLLAAGTISGILVVIAVLIPMINVRQIIHLFDTPAKGGAAQTSAEVGQSLGLSAPQPVPGPYERVADAGLPRVHLLGTGPELSEQVVMSIEVDDLSAEPPPRYYWRSLTYDIYTGQGWATSRTSSIPYREGNNIFVPDTPARVVRQHVRLTGETGEFIFSAGEILTLDWPFTLAWRAPSTGEPFSDQFAGQVNKDDYRVDALVSTATASQLRAINAPLPEWVRARYLSLPEGIPSRVFDLAAGVTIAQPTPYDRAVALERFLRSYTYSLDLPVPPADQDIVDYFLFDLRRGYCDYYATAMVVLARASGLPARLAVGYASGTYDPANSRYVVTAADAHSWVEIYFSGVGWVPFEPTGGQPEIGRTETLSESRPATEVTPVPFDPVWKRGVRQVGWGVAGLILLAWLGFSGWKLLENWRFRHLPPDEMVALLFRQLVPAGERLAVRTMPGVTPYEFAAAFALKIDELSVPGRLFALASGESRYIVGGIWTLADYFVRAAYAPEPLTETERKEALKLWQDLRWRLWWARGRRWGQSLIIKRRTQFWRT